MLRGNRADRSRGAVRGQLFQGPLIGALAAGPTAGMIVIRNRELR